MNRTDKKNLKGDLKFIEDEHDKEVATLHKMLHAALRVAREEKSRFCEGVANRMWDEGLQISSTNKAIRERNTYDHYFYRVPYHRDIAKKRSKK